MAVICKTMGLGGKPSSGLVNGTNMSVKVIVLKFGIELIVLQRCEDQIPPKLLYLADYVESNPRRS